MPMNLLMKDQLEENQQTNILFEMSLDLMCVLNADGYMLHLNPAWEGLLGYSLEELKSRKNVEFMHPDDVERSMEEAKNLWERKGVTVSFENRYISKTGEHKWLSWNATRKEGNDYIYAVARDITASKNNELTLKNLSLYHETLLSSANHIIISTDTQGVIKSFNRAAATALGYLPEEVIGSKTLSTFHKREELESKIKEFSQTSGKEIHSEHEFFSLIALRKDITPYDIWEYRRKDGSPFYIRMSITPIRDMEGKHLGLLGIAVDVTDRLKAEQLVREREYQLLAFIKNAPLAVALFDTEMHYISVSNRWMEEYLKDKGDCIGRSHYELFPDSHWKQFHERAIAGEIIKDDDYCFVRKDGRREWISWEIRPWHKADASVGGLIVTCENITFRKVAHAAVTEKSQMLNGILRNIPVVVYRINSKGIFTECIGVGLKVMGLHDNEMMGKKAVEVFPGLADIRQVNEAENIVFQSSGTYNGQDWYFQNHTFPDNVNNNGIIGFSFDITDKVLKEKEMQDARERAEKADKYKSRFLANMSHEIRTPLNAIIGFAEVFERKNLSVEQREHLHNITSSGSILLKLIGDILDLSKIEEGKLTVETESFNLREVLSSDLLPYKYNANKKGLNFNLWFDEDLPAYLFGDSNKIKQIIINLIGNALKFTKQGGITVSISRETPARQEIEKEVSLKFTVADTGIGIAPEKQKEIFDTFTQADSSIVKEYGGSGLGLSIVKQLVELMGGTIAVASPSTLSGEGVKGSAFSFNLKFKIDTSKNSNTQKAAKEQAIRFEQEIQILIAEDNPMNQALAEVILTRLGCKVQFAENGEEAVELFSSHRYDLVFMDVQMPIMNGYAATEMIRKKYGPEVPIIGLTANVYREDIQQCLRSGMDDYLGKPYNELQLYQIIKKWYKKSLVPPEPEKCTNLNFLKRSGDGNPEFIGEMISIFLKQNDEFIRNAEKALEEQDRSLLQMATHKVKSCYKMVGINSADELLRKLEHDVHFDTWQHLDELFHEVKTLSVKAISELKQEII